MRARDEAGGAVAFGGLLAGDEEADACVAAQSVAGRRRVVDVVDCVVAVERLVARTRVDAEDDGVVELGLGD